ncbi:MAG: zf-HC2 domain-containing protein [Pseudomonadota bacterium]
MNKCEKFQELISLYCYDELSQNDKQMVENHIVSCETCAAELQSVQDTLLLISQKTTPQMSDQFWEDYDVTLDEKIKTTPVSISSIFISVLDKMNDMTTLRRLSYAAVIVLCISMFLFINKQPPTTTGETDKKQTTPIQVAKVIEEKPAEVIPTIKKDSTLPVLSMPVLSLEEELILQEMILLSELGEDVTSLMSEEDLLQQMEIIKKFN